MSDPKTEQVSGQMGSLAAQYSSMAIQSGFAGVMVYLVMVVMPTQQDKFLAEMTRQREHEEKTTQKIVDSLQSLQKTYQESMMALTMELRKQRSEKN